MAEESNIVHKIEEMSKKEMSGFPSHHGVYHVSEVVELAKKISSLLELGQDQKNDLEMAAWMHDIGRKHEMKIAGSKSRHADFSAQKATLLLKSFKISPERKAKIVKAIAEHSNKEPSSELIGRILQDADRSERFSWKIGFFEIAQFAAVDELNNIWLSVKNNQLFPGITKESLEKIISGIKFVEEWYDMMNFSETRDICFRGYVELVGCRTILENFIENFPDQKSD